MKAFIMLAAFLFLTASHVQLAAQTPTPTPDSDEVKSLKEEKAQSELRKGIAEDKKAELEAKFPKPATSPLEGKTTVEGAVIESQMISYVSLSRAADRVITAIKGHFTSGENLAVYNERDINLMLSYRVAISQIDELVNQGYCQILTTAATNNLCPTPKPTPSPSPGPLHVPLALPAALPIAQSFLGAFVDMTALLRTNVEIKGQTFVIDEGPLVAEVFRAARANSSSNPADPKALPLPKFGALYYPYVFPPNIDSSQGSQILQRLKDVHKLRGNASQVIDAIEKDSTQIEKAAAKMKELKKVIEETLPKQSADAVALAGTLIQANCRRLSAEVDGIMKLPEGLQSDAMVRLIDRLKKDCPRLNPDKFAQLLGLSNVLRETAKDLEEAGIALGKAKTDKKDAEKNLSDQLALLKLNPEPSLPSPPPTTPDDRKDAATAAVAQLKAINAQFDSLVTSLIRTQGTDANPLTNYIRTERLSSALAKSCASSSTTPCASASITTDPGSYWLLLKVINAGGNNRIKTNLLVDIFTGGNRISHSGGVIIQYQLFDRSGQSVESGTVSEYTDYIKANKVPALTGSQR